MNTHISNKANGFSLIEIMISMLIGSVLLAGAIKVYEVGYKNNIYNENTLYMQSVARNALDFIADEIRHAGFMGPVGMSSKIAGRLDDPDGVNATGSYADPDDANSSVYNLSQSVGALSHEDVDLSDNCTTNPRTGEETCFGADAVAADQITIRRLSKEPIGTVGSPPSAHVGAPGVAYSDDSYIMAVVNSNQGEIFSVTDPIPTGYDDADGIYKVIARTLYVKRVEQLGGTAIDGPLGVYNRLAWSDAGGEINGGCTAMTCGSGWAVSGAADAGDAGPHVEDLQLQLGLDVDGNSVADYYVNPGSPDIESAPVVSAKIWVVVRSVRPEPSIDRAVTFNYADKTFTADDEYRYMLFNRTVRLWNAANEI